MSLIRFETEALGVWKDGSVVIAKPADLSLTLGTLRGEN